MKEQMIFCMNSPFFLKKVIKTARLSTAASHRLYTQAQTVFWCITRENSRAGDSQWVPVETCHEQHIMRFENQREDSGYRILEKITKTSLQNTKRAKHATQELNIGHAIQRELFYFIC